MLTITLSELGEADTVDRLAGLHGERGTRLIS